ncbi:MAG TPA: hypothetical protein VEG34_08610 [Thermoanaerobaculia bacterium]|nr:hypothetical protein [Thermoanaerobaculia bacterium]
MRFQRNRCLLWTLMVMVALLAGAGAALADEAKAADSPGNDMKHYNFRGPGGDDKGPATSQSFRRYNPFATGTAAICAEGSCNCSTCSCYGTFDCCVAGCVACWDASGCLSI